MKEKREKRKEKSCRQSWAAIAYRGAHSLIFLFSFFFSPFSYSQDSLRDIRGPLSLPESWWWLAVFAVLVVAGGLALYFRSRQKPALSAVPEVVRTPWEIALMALAVLEREPRKTPQEIKAFYSSLSVIVRGYIEQRFQIRAPEMTTEEFFAATQRSAVLSPEQQGFLVEFLNSSDLVKFAKFVPSDADMSAALEHARVFVQSTRLESTVGSLKSDV